MRYCSLDVESSGLDPARCCLLELACVVEDTEHPLPLAELPCWSCVVAHRSLPGDPYALALNHYLVERSLSNDDCLQPEEVVPALAAFLQKQGLGRANLAGKNVAFDLGFLARLPGWPVGEERLFRHRVLDPAVFFWQPARDACLPDTKTCLERAGLPMLATHRALDDARAVIALLRVGLERRAEVGRLQETIKGHSQRIAAQSELLSARAEKGGGR